MAGIGFELRRLARQDNLWGLVEGYSHSAIASTGPWVFTILALATISFFGQRMVGLDDLTNFRLVVIYNFAFSLVAAGPFVQVATRYLADSIFEKDVRDAPAMLLSVLLSAFAVGAVGAIPFYIGYVQLDPVARILAVMGFFIILGIWLTSVFLTALKDFDSITSIFGVGMLVTVVAAVLLGVPLGMRGMLLGFTLGVGLIFFALLARIFAEYPYTVTRLIDMRPYFRRYRDLALGGLFYNVAIWADEWVMWFADGRTVATSGLISYPDYDSAMFLAYPTIVPAMAAFVLAVETDFFEKYTKFYRDIQEHANLDRIAANQRAIVQSVLRGGRLFLLIQGSVAIVAILLAPRIFERLNISFVQIGMFRIAVLAVFFHALFLAILIVLSYFDMRRPTRNLQLLFLVTNVTLSLAARFAGFPYYGYGYFFASVVTCAAAFAVLARALNHLPYQAFVLSNASVE